MALPGYGRLGVAVCTVAALVAAPLATAAAVNASQSKLVSAVPSTATPDVNDGTVFALTQVGSRIIVGGTFSSASPHGSSSTVARSNILAFDAATGAIDPNFAPTLDGEVEDLTPGPTADTVYAAGYFNYVNGVKAKGVALLDTTTGTMVAGFKPASLNGAVYGVRLVGNRLFIGGTFTTVAGVAHQGLASLNPTTGALDPYVNVQLAGHHNYTGQTGQSNGPVGPRAMDVSPDGRHLLVIGNFKTADGLPRDQIVMVSIDGASAVVQPDWNTLGYTATCFANAFDTYVRDVDFAPDGSYFVVVATGGSGTNSDGTNSLCDTAARFETSATGSNIRPTWAIYSGQDTLASVAVTGTVVYVGGHQRWLNNSKGFDYAGEAAVPRPGIAALDPRNGMPYSWNPGRNPRGAGAFALLATATGLYVGSDTEYIGDWAYLRKRLAFFPLAGGASVAEAPVPTLPANVYLAGGVTPVNNVLFRVNAGGPSIVEGDGGPTWAADTSSAPSTYHNSGSSTASYPALTKVDSTVPAGTPTALFDNERYDPAGGTEMHWGFPVAAGTGVDVRLYFSNRCTCTSQPGQRVFNVSIDGTPFLTNFDPTANAGDQTATMRHKALTSDGTVDIDFGHVAENPTIDAIEIVRTDVPPPANDTLRYRLFDGSTSGATQNVASSFGWGSVRGAFEVGNTLFYASADGNLYQRSFDGTTLGSPTLIEPYDDPKWSDVNTGTGTTVYRGAKPDLYGQLGTVTGLAYRDGLIYYTRSGDSRLYYRYFEPESGIVGSDTFTAPGGVGMANVQGMFLSGGFLYWASRVDGGLHRDAFAAGTLSGDTVVSSPSLDGNDWRARALFVDGHAPPPNQPPTASIGAPLCSGLDCSFDGTGSSDSDGTVTSYAWNFGDGGTATGPTPAHTYGAPGNYTVTLTVTDDDNATGSTTRQVSVSSRQPAPISFVGGSKANSNATTKQVTVPAGVHAGDALLLLLSKNSTVTTGDPAGVTGWTPVDSVTNGSMAVQVWQKVATAADAGQTVTITQTTLGQADLQLLAYTGTDPTSPLESYGKAADSTTTASHTAPVVPVTAAGSWAVSYWTDKSSSTTSWTAPAGVTTRLVSIGTGGGRMTSLSADAGEPVTGSSYGGLTATTDVAGAKAESWTFVLAPALQ